jgi:hypothetical protein
VTGRHDDLAAGDTLRGEQVEVAAILDDPSGVTELPVDENTRPLLGCQPRLLATLGVHGRQRSDWIKVHRGR